MRTIDETSVVIVGGGATGVGTARDLAMRGISCLLVEQGDLCSGASSRFHGLLHSGARYAVDDPEAARECALENAILRRIAPECIEKTEGFFVGLVQDDPAWEHRWVPACAACGVEVVRLDPQEALLQEPALTTNIRSIYRVRDSAVDGFRMIRHNAVSAGLYGAKILTYTRLTGIETKNGRVSGVWTQSYGSEKQNFIACEHIVNATGSWSGEVARLAGLTVSVSPDRGLLLAFNHRFTERIINRLHKPSDGDIFVPHGTVVIYGTTSVPVERPDDAHIAVDEVLRLLREGETIFPRLRGYRMLRAFAGTRPLYTPDAASGRAATRNFVILDHEEEGLKGMVTVTGGKFTSFRLMAEKTADRICAKLGINRPCRTARVPLMPAHSEELLQRARKVFPAGGMDIAVARLGDVLEDVVRRTELSPWKKTLLCECELVTVAEFEAAATRSPGLSLGDVRRSTRMGMGTCQGNFCALRASAALLDIESFSAVSPRAILADFLEERWHGIRPLLWGRQLREVELERGIYAALLNLEGPLPETLPVCKSKKFAQPGFSTSGGVPGSESDVCRHVGHYDVIVVGAGLSGLTAALRAAVRGRRVLLLTSGTGVMTIGSGSIDLLGLVNGKVVSGDPFTWFDKLGPTHPYTLVGAREAACALEFLAAHATEAGLPLHVPATDGGNVWLPTAAGTLKPVFMTSPAMSPGGLYEASTVAVAGFRGIKDFSPGLITRGLAGIPFFEGKTFSPALLDIPEYLRGEGRDVTSLDIARFVETPDGTDWLYTALSPLAAKVQALVLPPVLGLSRAASIHKALEDKLGTSLMESVCPPPAVSGLRLHNALRKALNKTGAMVFDNVTVTRALVENKICRTIVAQQGGLRRAFSADSYIIATGGIFGKGIITRPAQAFERIFNIPLAAPTRLEDWAEARFFSSTPHAFASLGVTVDRDLRAVDENGETLLNNVFFAGRALQGHDFAAEKSGSGVAAVTGYFAGGKA